MNTQYIQHLVTPPKLYLMWKDSTEDTKRHVVGEMTEKYFRYAVGESDFQEAKKLGFKGYPSFQIREKEYKNPVSVFKSRCPPRERVDFPDYLRAFGLNADDDAVKNITDYQLLAYTGALVPLNPFNIASPFEGVEPPFEFVLQIAGFYYQRISVTDELKGEPLTLQLSPDNPHDENAIEVLHNKKVVGYIPRGYTTVFRTWIAAQQTALTVFRVNGNTAHPYLYAFVAVQ